MQGVTSMRGMNRFRARLRWATRRWPRLALVVQVAALAGLCVVCDALVRATRLPLPGSLLALGIVLALLASRTLPLAGLHRGAHWLLAEMLLFFVPAVMTVFQQGALLKSDGVRIFAVILIGTALVMTATALIVDRVWRWEQARAR